MTGQVLFDSHVSMLLAVTVALVNRLTPGHEGGTPVAAADDVHELRSRIAEVLVAGGYDVSPRAVRPGDAELIAEATAAARRVIQAVADDDRDAAADVANDLLRSTEARPQLDRFTHGVWGLHFHGPDDSLGRGWSAGLAIGLAMALGSAEAGRLGVCDAPVCDRVYVDTSRNGGRRFCSTRCQSRTKAAAHRARRASPSGA